MRLDEQEEEEEQGVRGRKEEEEGGSLFWQVAPSQPAAQMHWN